MPVLDIEGLRTDVNHINLQAKTYLNTFANTKTKQYTVTPDYLSSIVSPMSNDLRRIFIVLNKDSDDIKSIYKLVDSLDSNSIDIFNSTMKQVKDISDEMLGILDNYFATGNKVVLDLQLDASNLNESLNKLVSLLSGKNISIAIEENQDIDTVKVDDIKMGQLFLAYDERNNAIRLGICRLMALTLKGKTISSKEDGSDSISASDVVYLDPIKFLPSEVTDIVNYLYDHEVEAMNSDNFEEVKLAQRTIDTLLDFVTRFALDKDKIVQAAEYKRKYSKL